MNEKSMEPQSSPPAVRSGQKRAPLLPTQNLAGPALVAVTAVMSFLAMLALGSVLLVNAAATQWLARAGSAMSVQIIETRNQSALEQLPAVMRVLTNTPSLAHIRVLSQSELIALLEPWLGVGNVNDDLPIPQLIEVVPKASLNARAVQSLAAQIQAVAPGAALDTHGRWRATLQRAARAVHLVGILVLLVVGIATAMVIVFATRAGLAANRPILEVLHQIGARDRFIAHRFEAHFVKMAALAALAAFLAACAFFYGVSAFSVAARAPSFFLSLLFVPCATILVSWVVTHFYVLRNLHLYN